jgi:outer membrane protein OmpA-like peptidoglycan-associated protein
MSALRTVLVAAALAITLAALPARAAVACTGVSPGEPGREEYIVFFPVGSAELDQAARAVVQRAAARATATFPTEICLVGRTSPTGSPQANQRLAEQRIQAVRNALMQRGVRRETLGSVVAGAGFGARVDWAENRADRSVTIVFVR